MNIYIYLVPFTVISLLDTLLGVVDIMSLFSNIASLVADFVELHEEGSYMLPIGSIFRCVIWATAMFWLLPFILREEIQSDYLQSNHKCHYKYGYVSHVYVAHDC